jgi:hypothetical protein
MLITTNADVPTQTKREGHRSGPPLYLKVMPFSSADMSRQLEIAMRWV